MPFAGFESGFRVATRAPLAMILHWLLGVLGMSPYVLVLPLLGAAIGVAICRSAETRRDRTQDTNGVRFFIDHGPLVLPDLSSEARQLLIIVAALDLVAVFIFAAVSWHRPW